MASKAESAHASGFSGKIGWGNRPALLLVDVCNAYWSEDSPLDTRTNPASAAAPASIARLVAAAREGRIPLVWTRVEYTEPDMADAGLFFSKVPLLTVFQRGKESGLESWVPGLEPATGEVVIFKRYPSAFFATDLTTRLQLASVDTLVICGVSTSGCVRATALDAMCHGYRPMVWTDLAMHESLWTSLIIILGSWRSLRRQVTCCPRREYHRYSRKDG